MSDDVQSVDTSTDQSPATESGLYDLESVDPTMRAALEPHLKAIEANATKKFQEAAEYRKGWAPYEELGVNNVPIEVMQELFEFARIANDPEQFQQWWQEVGETKGFHSAELDTDDLDLTDADDLTPERIKELVAEAVSENLNPIQERFQAQDQERALAEANEAIEQQMAQIRSDNPNLPEGAEDDIAQLAMAYVDDDPDNAIAKGFEKYKALVGQGEKNLFAQKSNQPMAPESTGTPATSAEGITSFDDPRLKEQARERMRQASQ